MTNSSYSKAYERGMQTAHDEVARLNRYNDCATYTESLGRERSCLLYTSPSPRDQRGSRMPSSA